MSPERLVWAEVSLSALRHNLKNIRALLAPQTRFCAVVKADAYGHGMVPVAQEAVKAGADYLAVAQVEEALTLRTAGFIIPILILGYTTPAQSRLVVRDSLTQTIFNIEQAEILSAEAVATGKTVKIHVKIDTGMGRLGISLEEVADFFVKISALPNLIIEGAFTHFATADSKDKTYTRKQFSAFIKALEVVKALGIHIPIRHCANSAATLDLQEMHLDMVRCGIIVYGLTPFDETSLPFKLKPALSLKARIVMLKEVPAGTSLSYGCTFVTKKKSFIATLPLGYADGWSRLLSGRGAEIMHNGQRALVVGRICMDHCLADVSDLESVKEGDEVLFFGGDELTVNEVAAKLGTINYEIVCNLGPRVPRIYI